MTESLDRDELLAVLDQTEDAVLLVRRDGRVRFGNRSAKNWLENGPVAGQPVEELLHDRADEFLLAWQRAEQSGHPQRTVAYCPASAAWLDLQARPGSEGALLQVRDITEHRRDQLVGSVVAQTGDAAAAGVGTIRALAAAGAALRGLTGYELATVWLRDLAGTVRLIGSDHAGAPELDEVVIALREAGIAADRPARRSLEVAVPRFTPHLPDDLDPVLAEPIAAAGLRVGLHLPLHWPDGSAAVIGLLTRARPGDDDWHAVLSRAHPRLAARAMRVRDHQELSQLFDLAGSGLCIVGVDGHFHRVNPELAAMLGRDVDELIGRPYLDVVHPDDRRALSEAAARLFDHGGVATPFEHRVVLPSGEERTLAWRSRGSPREGLVYAAARDVTLERRRERSEADQRRLLEDIALGVPLEHTLVQIAASLTARFGDGVRGAVWLTDEDDGTLRRAGDPTRPPPHPAAHAAVEATSSGRHVVTDAPTDGAPVCWAVPICGQDNEPLGAVVLEADRAAAPSAAELALTEDAARLASLALVQHRTSAWLQRSEERFRLLADAMADALWDWDLVNDTVWFNDAFVEHFGLREVPGESVEELRGRHIHEQDRDRVRVSLEQALTSGQHEWEVEYRFVHGDGNQTLVGERATIMRDEHGRALRTVGGMWDLTAQREREAERERAQRLASLGTLAGGLAHDLGNVLAPIMLSTELLSGRDLDGTSARLVERIQRSSQRGTAMIDQVMAFARGTAGEKRPVDLSELIAGLAEDASGIVAEHITILAHVEDGVPSVLGDAAQLHQVLLNLAVNARDAMPDGGTLTLTAARAPVGSGPERVRLSVDDTGIGMTEEVRERIFEPFFTTKPEGKGTGLGLAVAMAIIESHGGTAAVTSQPDHGTRVAISLPAAPDELDVWREGTPEVSGRGGT